jgi:type III restriction enzyme
MELKNYQKQTLAVLRRFLAEARVTGPQAAYEAIAGEPEQAERLKGYRLSYRPLNGLEATPYICLRLPTGGGKTILAAHSVAVAREAWVEKDYPVVLWLVPTTTIRKQTVEALKNHGHPYRQVLDDAFEGRVRVFDIADFAQITQHDLISSCCLIVATIQSLRVTNTEGRKVYSHNENLEPHFSGVPRRRVGLETIEEGKPGAGTIKFSFANLLHLHGPLMIVDEAHTAVTGLSQEMQARVNPTAIIEYTATPDATASNMLHSVSAQELKEEEMIKLPVVLAEHPTWQQAVDGALARQAELEAIARLDKDYIRPIVLFQAQDRNETANVAALKGYLVEQGIAGNRIRIATGDQRELDEVNLFDPACEVDFVITVEALKEGWDCSFAYVFCSLANVQSATAAEQLLGRVLRMPYAKARADVRLNKAYAHLASPSFSAAAVALRDRMVAMGFDQDEAAANIEAAQQVELDTALFGYRPRPLPQVEVAIAIDGAQAEAISCVAPAKLAVVSGEAGPAIRLTGFLTPQEKDRLVAVLPEDAANRVREEIGAYEAEHAERISPADRGARFVVPALMAHVQGDLELADTDLLMEHCNWSLLDHSARLDAADFDLKQTANTFEIDLDRDHHLTVLNRNVDQFAFDVDVEGWTESGLVLFLAKQVREVDLSPAELIVWLTQAISHLTGARRLPLTALMQCKYVLARKLKERVNTIRRDVREKVYQRSLFGPEARAAVSYKRGFVFAEGMFASARKQTGRSYTFTTHFMGPDQIGAFDGKDGGDEEQCARQLDSLPDEELKHWVRNVAQHPNAFWLPLAGHRFYPDFIAELTDGRLLVVEYKGEPYVTNDDTKEKVAVARKWEEAMGGEGLFLLAEKVVEGMSPREQIMAYINRSVQ